MSNFSTTAPAASSFYRRSYPSYGVLVLEPIRNQEHALVDLHIKWANDWMLAQYMPVEYGHSVGYSVFDWIEDSISIRPYLLSQLEKSCFAEIEELRAKSLRLQWRFSVLDDAYIAFVEVMNTMPSPSPAIKSDNISAKTDLVQANHELSVFFNLDLELHCITDRNGNILKTNSAWTKMLGYTDAELLHINYLELVHPNDMVAALAGSPYLDPNQPAQRKQFRLRKKEGSYLFIDWHISFVEDRVYASGREIPAEQQSQEDKLMFADKQDKRGAFRDNSVERTLAKEAIQQSEQRFKAIFNLTYQFIGLMRPDGILLEVNETALQAAGQSLGEMIGKPFWETYWWQISDEEKQKLQLAIQQAAKGELVRYEVEIWDANHEVRALDMSIKPIVNEHGKVVLLIPEGRDITRKKRAENALKESEQRFREIAENVTDAFWIHSARPFQLVYINPAFERGVGYSTQQLMENPELLLEAVVEEDRQQLMADFKRYSQGEVLTGQYRLLSANKMIRWFTIRTFVMKDCHGQPLRYIGVASDITSQKEKELVLQQSLAREKELNKLKSQFVAIASHEFRTPLATIQSSVDLISLYLDKSDLIDQPPVRRHLAVIEKEIVAFSKLLTDVLTIGKMDEGKITFNPRQTDLVALCQEIITTHFGQYRHDRSVLLFIDGTPYMAFIDEKLIKHVIINLLSNAFKFSTSSNPELRIRFTPKKLFVSIVDHGIGIPREDIPSLFQPFFRAGNATSVQGTGLGLAISRQFVELHGGHFTVSSEQNQGTTFRVTIPTNSE